MAGAGKWLKVKRKNTAHDQKRGQIVTTFIREIAVAIPAGAM